MTDAPGAAPSIARAAYRIELFRASNCRRQSGQGRRFLGGATQVTTNRNGAAVFSVDLPAVNPTTASIVATATNAGQSTSEFSACQPVSQP